MKSYSVETTEDYFRIDADEYHVGPYGVSFSVEDDMVAFVPYGPLVAILSGSSRGAEEIDEDEVVTPFRRG